MLFVSNALMLWWLTSISCHCKKKEDKLLLSPIELIDLVRKEQHKRRLQPAQGRYITTYVPYSGNENRIQTFELEPSEDETTLKKRKIWSRWSKWSHCSATCGGGTTARHRTCVLGRCAPGEFEEQHRPCALAPCALPVYNMTEEIREFE